MAPLVLVVDDDPVTADHFVRMLRSDGYRAVVAYNGQSGLQQAAEARPDAVFFDLQMPLMDGASLLEHFRADTTLCDVPAVILTGDYGMDETMSARLQALGANIQFKPLWADDLLELVHKLLPFGTPSPRPTQPAAA